MKNRFRPQSLALVALVLGVAATVFAWFLVGRQVEGHERFEFAQNAQIAANDIERRIQRYVDLLHGLDALVNHEPNLTRAHFKAYVDGLELGSRQPGVQALEFIRRVPDAEYHAYTARVRSDRALVAEGYPGFSIKPEGRRAEYWVIEYLEPMAGNEAAFGLDIRTRAALEAAERSRDSGEAVMTGRYRLMQESGSSFGLVIYMPVYGEQPLRGYRRPRTVEERRATLTGFVNVVLRVDDTFASMIADPVAQGLRMRIHDRGPTGQAPVAISDESVFYRTPGPRRQDHELGITEWRPRHMHDLSVAGRQWRIEFETEPRSSPWIAPLPLLALGAGLVVSLLLYGMLRTLSRTRSEALTLAREANQELRTQLSFTQQLIEAIPNPVFFKDAGGKYLGCNQAFERYVDLPRDKIIGRTVMDILPIDLADRSITFDAKLLDKPGAQAYEAHFTDTRGGGSRDVIVNKATFFDAGGGVAGLVGVIVDITERKRLEASTRDSNEKLRAVIHAAPLAIIARGRDRSIQMWNPSAERMFGWKESEVLGTKTSIVPEHLREETERLRLRAEAGETIWIEETRRLARDGRLIDVSMTIAPIQGADGKVDGTMVTIADISRRKLAEAALRESEAQLRLAMDAAQLGMWYWECDTDRFN